MVQQWNQTVDASFHQESIILELAVSSSHLYSMPSIRNTTNTASIHVTRKAKPSGRRTQGLLSTRTSLGFRSFASKTYHQTMRNFRGDSLKQLCKCEFEVSVQVSSRHPESQLLMLGFSKSLKWWGWACSVPKLFSKTHFLSGAKIRSKQAASRHTTTTNSTVVSCLAPFILNL